MENSKNQMSKKEKVKLTIFSCLITFIPCSSIYFYQWNNIANYIGMVILITIITLSIIITTWLKGEPWIVNIFRKSKQG